MNRKVLICLLTTALLSIAPFVAAQQAKKVYRVGFLSPRPGIESREEAFRQGLRELGYVEGQNLVIEWRFTKGNPSLLPGLAAELVRLKMDCILGTGVNTIHTLKQLTDTIPIVIGTIAADPVQQGLVASLARPGGNITGFTGIAYDIAGKRLELLRETVPKASRVAILVAPGLAAQAHVKETEVAARGLRMQLQLLEVKEPEGLDNAFQAARERRAEVLTVVGIGLLNSHRPRILNLAVKARLPAIYDRREFVDYGGLMSYGTNLADLARRAATYVDKILKGAKPADLPVEQPIKFEFIINLKAAKQIGLTIPPNVLVRADKVIR